MSRSNQQKIYSTNVFDPGENLSGVELRELLNHNISGYPLMGDEPYRNWATYVSNSVAKKSKDFAKPKFEKFSKNSLYVVVETPERICVDDINKAIKYLEEVWPEEIGFDCVYIQQYEYIIEISVSSPNKFATIYLANDTWGFFSQS